jgi:uncharacterized membrane protein YdjX (TVP38/TMEM64 family)
MRHAATFTLALVLFVSGTVAGYVPQRLLISSLQFTKRHVVPPLTGAVITPTTSATARTTTQLFFFNDDRTDEEIEEEVRLDILKSRRDQIRAVLKSAESVRNFRLSQGLVPAVDEKTGRVISDNKLAVALTAFCVGAGAIALRIGGRAALLSVVGLDFANDNPDLRGQLDQVLEAADSVGPAEKLLLFTLAWTAVKLFLFDAGGVVLALSSGILFGGVIQGAVASSAAATFGSAVAFGLAKLDTPVRRKALEVLDEYPSLRGIEKVVAQDGLKAILTLRLAPILPIPIGLYNYIYGVTGVPLTEFMGGIFLGSLKPYLLDSYLGYFGKEVLEGANDTAGFQDVLLLLALGFSVLIGVFASQLASETWDSVAAEVEAEKKAKEAARAAEGGESEAEDEEDGVTRELLGWKLPDFVVEAQTSYKRAEAVVQSMIDAEHEARVWNYTTSDGGPPAALDPARAPTSPEVTEVGKKFDFVESLYGGMALSPTLLGAWMKYSNPLFDASEEPPKFSSPVVEGHSSEEDAGVRPSVVSGVAQDAEMLQQLLALKAEATLRLGSVEERIREITRSRSDPNRK